VGSIHIQLAPAASSHDASRPSFEHRHHGPIIYAHAERVVDRVEKILEGKIRGLSELVVQVEGSEEKRFCSCMTGG
jgi:zinc transporter 5/7